MSTPETLSGVQALDPADTAPRLSAPPELILQLQSTVEELRVTEEELRQQNEELLSTRQALEGEHARYRSLFDQAADGYVVTDLDGVIREANDAAAALLGKPRRFLWGKPLLVFVSPEDRQGLLTLLSRMPRVDAPQVWTLRIQPRSEDARAVETRVSVAPVRHGQEPPTLGWLLRDVTALREAQRRLVQTERLAAIGQMVAGLVHESRNAFQRGQSCLEMLALEVQDRPRALELIARAQAAQEHVCRLFEDVRAYAAPIRLDRRSCMLDAVWREAWADLEPAWRGRAAELCEDAGGADLALWVDAFRLGQVFRNVFENALGASPDPVRIAVTCADAELRGVPVLAVAVRDNGPGLTPEQRERIFEPFFTTKVRGTGLGMAIAKRAVEAHEGQIEVEETSAGAGIRILLPRGRAGETRHE